MQSAFKNGRIAYEKHTFIYKLLPLPALVLVVEKAYSIYHIISHAFQQLSVKSTTNPLIITLVSGTPLVALHKK